MRAPTDGQPANQLQKCPGFPCRVRAREGGSGLLRLHRRQTVMRKRFGSALVVLNLLLSPLCPKLNAANSAPENCNQPTPKPITFVEVPGRPFEPIPSADGCWIYVSLPQADRN